MKSAIRERNADGKARCGNVTGNDFFQKWVTGTGTETESVRKDYHIISEPVLHVISSQGQQDLSESSRG